MYRYLTIILTLKAEINLDTLEPLVQLNPLCISELKKLGSKAKTTLEVIGVIKENTDNPISKAIEAGIEKLVIQICFLFSITF